MNSTVLIIGIVSVILVIIIVGFFFYDVFTRKGKSPNIKNKETIYVEEKQKRLLEKVSDDYKAKYKAEDERKQRVHDIKEAVKK